MHNGVVDEVTHGQPPSSTLLASSPQVKLEDVDDPHGFGNLYGAEDDRPRRRLVHVESEVKSEHIDHPYGTMQGGDLYEIDY